MEKKKYWKLKTEELEKKMRKIILRKKDIKKSKIFNEKILKEKNIKKVKKVRKKNI